MRGAGPLKCHFSGVTERGEGAAAFRGFEVWPGERRSTLFLMSRLAPLAIKTTIASSLPLYAAVWSGVFPS